MFWTVYTRYYNLTISQIRFLAKIKTQAFQYCKTNFAIFLTVYSSSC